MGLVDIVTIDKSIGPIQSDQKIEKNHPTLVNVAKTVAKTLKLKLKDKNRRIKLLSKVKISTTNYVLKLII